MEKVFGWQKKEYRGWSKAGRIVLTFLIVNFAWIIFRSPSIGFATDFLTKALSFGQGLNVSLEGIETLAFICIALLPFLMYEIMREFVPVFYSRLKERWYLRWAAYLCTFAMILMAGVLDGGSFIYVSF